jgi:hypothetical protein
MNILVLAFLGYLLYRFVAGFIVPIFRTTRQMRQQFHNMNNPSNGQKGNPSGSGNGSPSQNGGTEAPKPGSSKVGEYIDFEEVE